MLQSDGTPIYLQIAEWIETEILKGNFQADEKVYSQYKLAEMFTINPATAAKGLNVLANENILYTKRGLGKFVTKEAKAIIIHKRKNQKLKGLINEIVMEAKRLHVREEELMVMLKKAMKESGGQSGGSDSL
ncbi:GntR family transcriptional regulator [Compostibacillus humi]|mgnify:CR=1 FL=1|uniref:GntR family transcriptional regulator n=1 Tax=Compostibacillus humi TaxID=1245525 RepID=A0A8J2TSW3_9BACI|nr:GntR family transcriptional regulator [Compostibacillus humi]GFZ87837.1 GntR family transcriptional regulator [Compostibacillus humi]HLT55084.1 GntR family transcriptional regulator [Bacillota bacterium]